MKQAASVGGTKVDLVNTHVNANVSVNVSVKVSVNVSVNVGVEVNVNTNTLAYITLCLQFEEPTGKAIDPVTSLLSGWFATLISSERNV